MIWLKTKQNKIELHDFVLMMSLDIRSVSVLYSVVLCYDAHLPTKYFWECIYTRVENFARELQNFRGNIAYGTDV